MRRSLSNSPNKTRFVWLIGLLALLFAAAGASSALAQDITPRHTDPYWQAQFWNNTTLSGQPAVVRSDSALDFDWGFNAPADGISEDNFSARWTRYIDVAPGNYRFTAVADDGIRVWVDGRQIIDEWREQPANTYSNVLYLGPGHHLVVVEYYEFRERAVAKVSWQLDQQPQPPTPTPYPPSTGPWRADYFNNGTLSGPPALTRYEQTIDYNWGYGSPGPQVQPDLFSARWIRSIDLPAGNYRFRMTVDDGGRLFVNGHTLIDAWKEQGPTAYTGDIYLPGGPITVQMEYFERNQSATAQLTWERIDGQQPPTPTPPSSYGEWRAEYWNNRDLAGNPTVTRNEQFIDFNWGTGSPASGVIPNDNFSARWSRTLDLPAGWYRFIMTVDDGGRLILGGRTVIDAWKVQPSTTYETRIYHTGGRLDVRMEYFEETEVAAAQLLWALLGSNPPTYPTPTPPPPVYNAVIVDNQDSGFVRGGNAGGWETAYEGYNGQLNWSRNNYRAQSGYNWGRWYAQLVPNGRYEVFVYIPERYSTTSSARYWVSHAGGYTQRTVNQSTNGNRWVSLGTYTFRGNQEDYVSLADVTYEQYLSRLIAWDAVKWEPR
ncbi:MAG: PA14 domain-containing protein [Caldilineaceae bacterium]